ncbi:MAG: hypothetical protein BRC35_00415 [Cyanobacteria bacterium QH_10_48_56]|nr:MAG: hypothetical protein BRC35_00415 [Cyanobacteria bacterium QH_10_48_56]
MAEPRTGASCFWEFSHLDSLGFGNFLKLFSQQYSESLNFIQVERTTAHKAKSLEIPNNVILLFQPSHSPELNPIERVWQYVKDMLSWELFASLTGQDSLLISLSVAGN